MLRRLWAVAAGALALSLSASTAVTINAPIWRDGTIIDPVDGHVRLSGITTSLSSASAAGRITPAAGPVGTIVIDPAKRAKLRQSTLYGRGGATGALTAIESVDADIFSAALQWVKADGNAVDLGNVRMETLTGVTVAADDVMAVPSQSGWVDLTDLNTKAVDRVPLNGLPLIKTIGRTVIAGPVGSLPGSTQIHLLRNENGVVSDLAIPEPPCQVDALGDGDGQAVIAFCTNRTVGLIDLHTGAFTAVSQRSSWPSPDVSRLTATHVIWNEYAIGPLNWAPRSGGAATTPAITGAQYPLLGMSGQWLLAGDADHRERYSPLMAIPAAGGPMIKVVDAPLWLAQLPDQTLMTLAGLSGHQGIYHIAPGLAGSPVATLVRAVPPADAPTLAIQVAGRRLVTVDGSADGNWVGDRSLGAAGPLVTGPRRTLGTGSVELFCNAPCALLAATGATTAYRTPTDLVVVDARGRVRRIPYPAFPPPERVWLTDTYLAWFGSYEVGHLIDLETGQASELQVTTTPFALWHNTMWTAQPDFLTTGIVRGLDLKTGAVTTVTTPARCYPQAFYPQVVGRWLAWRCGGVGTAPSGVIDMATGRYIPIGAENYGALGDGFLVYLGPQFESRFVLSRLDLTVSPPSVSTLVDMGSALIDPTQGARWNADAYGGQVTAWSDNVHRVHVTPIGVANTSPLEVLRADVPASLAGVWSPTWALSKPAHWTLTVRVGGTTVGTLNGDSYGTAVTPDWTPIPTGTPSAPSGLGPRRSGTRYSWTLVLMPADGVGGNLTLAGSIMPGQIPPRRMPDF